MDFSSIQTIYYQFGVTAVGIILFFAGKYFIKKIVKNHAVKHKFDTRRITYTVKFFNICWAIIILSIIAITWNVSLRGLSLYFASIFTVIGVAFFAQWSILSNVTHQLSYSLIIHIKLVIKLKLLMVKIQ